jgi:GT2 family glycosyltransferase
LNKKVAILLVLFNEELYIEKLAKSITNQTYKEISVYAFDSNSSDSSVSTLYKYIPDASIVLSEVNLGFAKGNNIIAKNAINNGEEYLFILNTDMELESDCVTKLVETFSNNDEIVGVGPLIYFGTDEGRTTKIQSFADNANFSNARTRTLYSGDDLGFEDLPQTLTVNTLHGGCFMIRSSVVSEIGLFNEDNFMYNDEIDLAYRINNYKGKLIVCKNAITWHYHDWSKKNKTGFYRQYFYINRNRLLFFYRYNKYLSIIREILIELFSIPVKLLWAKRTAGLKLLKYYYLGYFHGLFNKKGKAKIRFE